MPKKEKEKKDRLATLEKSLRSISREIKRLNDQMTKHEESRKAVSRSIATIVQQQSILLEALGLSSQSRKGDRGILDDFSASLLHLDEFLLRNSERIENIFVTLKNHRTMLARLNDMFFKLNEKAKIKIELGVMKNTLSILALSGNEMDVTIAKEIKALEESLETPKVDLNELRKSKNRLDKKFDSELKRFDLEALFTKRKDIPGYV